MKLNYKEITPCLKASVLRWEGMLDSVQRTSIDRETLTEMVKSGKNLLLLNILQIMFNKSLH